MRVIKVRLSMDVRGLLEVLGNAALREGIVAYPEIKIVYSPIASFYVLNTVFAKKTNFNSVRP